MVLSDAEVQQLRALQEARRATDKVITEAYRRARESGDQSRVRKLDQDRRKWDDELTAAAFVRRSPATLRRWKRKGLVRVRIQRGRRGLGIADEWFYNRLDIRAALHVVHGRKHATRVAGTGRPRNEGAREAIVRLLERDFSVSNRALARQVGVSHTFVASVRAEWQEKTVSVKSCSVGL